MCACVCAVLILPQCYSRLFNAGLNRQRVYVFLGLPSSVKEAKVTCCSMPNRKVSSWLKEPDGPGANPFLNADGDQG